MAIRYLDEQPNINNAPIESSEPATTVRKIRYLDEQTSPQLEGNVSYDANPIDSAVKGLSNIPGAIVSGIGDIINKTGQTAENLGKDPVKTVTSIPESFIAGGAEALSNIVNGIANTPGTIENIYNGTVGNKERVPFTDYAQAVKDNLKTNQFLPDSARELMNQYSKASEQAPIANLAGQMVPYVVGNAVIPGSSAVKFGAAGALGTPSTNLSDRITSAGANAAISPESLGTVGKVAGTVKKVTGISKLDEALRQNLAGISPEVYNDVLNSYFKGNNDLINSLVGNNIIDATFGNKEIITKLDTLNRESTQAIKDYASSHKELVKNRYEDFRDEVKEKQPNLETYISDVANSISGKLEKEYNAPTIKSDLFNQAIKITEEIKNNVAQHEKDLGKNVGIARSELDNQRIIPVNNIQQGINAIIKSYAQGTDINPAKIGANKTLQQINEILDRKAKSGIVQSGKLGFTTDIFNPDAGVSPRELNQIKKLIQDNTTWDATASKEGNTLKTELYKFINEEIQKVDPEYAKANKAYEKTIDALDSLSEVTRDTLATKLSNPDSIAGKRVIDKLTDLDSILPEGKKISPQLNQLREVQTKLQEAKEVNNNPLLKASNLENLINELSKTRTPVERFLKEGHPTITTESRIQLKQLVDKDPTIISKIDKASNSVGFLQFSNNSILELFKDSIKTNKSINNPILKGKTLQNIFNELAKNNISLKEFLENGGKDLVPDYYKTYLNDFIKDLPVEEKSTFTKLLNAQDKATSFKKASSEMLGVKNSNLSEYAPYALGEVILPHATVPIGLAAGVKALYSPAGQRLQLFSRKAAGKALSNKTVQTAYQTAVASELNKRDNNRR